MLGMLRRRLPDMEAGARDAAVLQLLGAPWLGRILQVSLPLN